MDIREILKRVDHTKLSVSTTKNDVLLLCDEAREYMMASICIPPAFVRDAKEYAGENIVIGTVIGFPCGYQTTRSKVFETEDALKNGATEIDMVICNGDVKSGEFEKIKEEIKAVKKASGNNILKVIIETCLLTEEEKIAMCKIVTEAGADYIKTSTGFSSGGATGEDIVLLRKHIGKEVKIKASGGIRTINDAMDFINLGASRLGTSSIVKIMREARNNIQ